MTSPNKLLRQITKTKSISEKFVRPQNRLAYRSKSYRGPNQPEVFNDNDEKLDSQLFLYDFKNDYSHKVKSRNKRQN